MCCDHLLQFGFAAIAWLPHAVLGTTALYFVAGLKPSPSAYFLTLMVICRFPCVIPDSCLLLHMGMDQLVSCLHLTTLSAA